MTRGHVDTRGTNTTWRLGIAAIVVLTAAHGDRSIATLVYAAAPQQVVQTPPAGPKELPAGLPSETPAQFRPSHDGFDYERRDVMIPMRDGAKLHTVILVPRRGKRAPILLTIPRASDSADRLQPGVDLVAMAGRRPARSVGPARCRVFRSDVLAAAVKIGGQPIANLVASTSGTDSNWVVKLIDVYPDEVAGQAWRRGYQLMVSADIFRGRYRESFEMPRPIEAGKALPYRFALPTANHVFLPGHRIMVQIQSSWFPLYDRNPQTFVPNIFWAKPGDYRKAVQRIFHAPGQASYVELPVVR